MSDRHAVGVQLLRYVGASDGRDDSAGVPPVSRADGYMELYYSKGARADAFGAQGTVSGIEFGYCRQLLLRTSEGRLFGAHPIGMDFPISSSGA